MQFQKGQPRPANAGRKKGSLNKKKIPKVADYLANKDLNPAEEILKILEEDQKEEPNKRMSKSVRIQVWMDLLSYCQGKPQSEINDDSAESDGELLEKFQDVPSETLLKLIKNEAK